MRGNGGKIGPKMSSTISGLFNLIDQQILLSSNEWPLSITEVTISPPLNGLSTWNLRSNGAIDITSGTYDITPSSTFTTSIKLWGQGGKSGIYSSGAGGALTALFTLSAGQTYRLTFTGGGAGGGTNGTGGNCAGIFLGTTVSTSNAIAIAAGGGGGASDDGGRGAVGGAGGYTSGANSSGFTGTTAGGGSQTAGGTAGGGSNPGTAGSALQGGTGGSGGGYQSGGGGGGYYGGGGGGIQFAWAGSGGGGGSNFANTSLLSSITHYSGSGTTAGNSSDTNRDGAGSGATGTNVSGGVGRIYISIG